MYLRIFLVVSIISFSVTLIAQSKDVNLVLEELEQLQSNSRAQEAILLLTSQLQKEHYTPEDRTYLYANLSGLYASTDSLKISKNALDTSFDNAEESGNKSAMATAYRAKAYFYDIIGLRDEAMKAALQGLKLLEKSGSDFKTKYHLNYILYRIYSKWKNPDKMETYIKQSEKFALQSGNENIIANAYNGISSMFLEKLAKTKNKLYADSSYSYLQKSILLHQHNPGKVASGTFSISCINMANYFLEHSNKNLAERKAEAYKYLEMAEKELSSKDSASKNWINIYGIKSDFALEENDLATAEQMLLKGLMKVQDGNDKNSNAELMVYKGLADIAAKKNDFRAALTYQRQAENILKNIFDQRQMFNAQKLEIQYEIDKKNTEVATHKRQTLLYAVIAIASVLGLIFLFLSYHFKLKYSNEREKKLEKEKEEVEKNAQLQVRLEREEQARLKAEQQLMELQQLQLQKQALADSLMIEQKNEMLKRIQSTIDEGSPKDVQKLLKEEALISEDFEEVRMHIQQLHPNFFNQLTEKAIQKLTPLDLKYCAYIHLQMTTRQISQLLHVTPHSVRMFKYRLKQKFDLKKDDDLETFLKA